MKNLFDIPFYHCKILLLVNCLIQPLPSYLPILTILHPNNIFLQANLLLKPMSVRIEIILFAILRKEHEATKSSEMWRNIQISFLF